MQALKTELESRGLLYQTSSDNLFKKFDEGNGKFYCGFDPTADSLHLGNFIGFMVAIHMMRRGNTYIALTGGATGMIGDPGGKDAERSFLSVEALDNNQKKIQSQMETILGNIATFTGDDFSYESVNNKDFYTDMGYLDFLREIGKYITVNVMMGKDTVKKRIEDPAKSISYTEFSYMLLQGYDFCHLFKQKDVTLQIGGQDQWGNLVTGTELIRKKYDADTGVMTWPLITDASGKKFGKSEGNALWLDPEKTTPYELYQYFMNTADADIERYMKMLTLIEVDEIHKIVMDHLKVPEERKGQKMLAFGVVEIIHGTVQAELAEKITEFMFGNEDKIETLNNLDTDSLRTFQKAMGGVQYEQQSLFELIVQSGLANSNSEARNALQSGAISINQAKISDPKYDFSSDFIGKGTLLLQKGKKNLRIITK
ncbi:tyrosine--tRNA ligase [Candidatus Gracilibacteria bacterium]|nr:tyrosine--tRNA ligase [Candidatus Gracilibacteria bacterium]